MISKEVLEKLPILFSLKIKEHFFMIAFAIISPFCKASFPPTTNVPIDLYPSINVAEFL